MRYPENIGERWFHDASYSSNRSLDMQIEGQKGVWSP